MPLYVSKLGLYASCEIDIFQIVRCDTGIGQEDLLGDPTVHHVTYAQSATGAGQDRMKDLVTTSANIVITAVDGSYVTPDGSVITASAGITLPADADNVIRVIYDVTNDYYAFDTNGVEISIPRPVLLFHELSHAFHRSNGTWVKDAAEVQAETDENTFRLQVSLTLRDVNNHDGALGSGNGETVPDCAGVCKGCFIVTAATGSSTSAEVRKLQAARDGILDRSTLVASFLARLMQEYYVFSQSIADRMRRDRGLKKAVDRWMVEPLVRFDLLFDSFRACHGDPAAFISAVARSTALPDPALAGRVADAAEAMADRLDGASEGLGEPPTAAGTDGLAEPEAVFAAVGAAIATLAHRDHVAWLARALALYWRAAASLARGTVGREAEAVGRGITNWLAAVPIPPDLFEAASEAFIAELRVLADTVFLDSHVRRRLAQRALGLCMPSSVETARAALDAAGYGGDAPGGHRVG